MHAVIARWDPARSEHTVESLRGFLCEEAVDRFSQAPGPRSESHESAGGS